ncbi:MAG: FAD-binding oxidoreductase [Gemmatimonadetes bacterium]|nr:FAD-binding oxidoreductase [Gemmatimonadota bacterium]
MNSLAGMLTDRLSAAQVVDGIEAERWAVCGRIPQAVVFPESEEQVAEILSLSSEEGWQCIPGGKGGWLHGGQPPQGVDVVVSAERMNEISAYEPADMFIEAQAGAELEVLERRTLECSQWIALDPPGGERGTLGAMVAVGAAGPLEAGFGSPRDQVLGATLVTGDGRVLGLGGRVVKNVAGFDLLKLVTGSWGTLGMITSVTMRVHPVPATDRSLLFKGRDPAEAAALACRLAQAPLSLAAVELLVPGDAESGANASSPLVAVRILESVDGADEAERLVSERAGIEPFQRLEGEQSAAIFENVRAMEDGAELVLRLSLLPSRLPELVEMTSRLSGLYDPTEGWGMRLAGHAQTGVLRVMIAKMTHSTDGLDQARVVLGVLRRSLEAEGGSLVVSQGPPEIVGALGAWGDSGPVAPFNAGIRAAFDPASILAQGRLPQ